MDRCAVSLPHANPGSTGSSSPLRPLAAMQILVTCSKLLCWQMHHMSRAMKKATFRSPEGREESCIRSYWDPEMLRRLIRQGVAEVYKRQSPAMPSRTGVSAACRGVRRPSCRTFVSPRPSMRTKAKQVAGPLMPCGLRLDIAICRYVTGG